MNQSAIQSISLSINQSISLSINQPINHLNSQVISRCEWCNGQVDGAIDKCIMQCMTVWCNMQLDDAIQNRIMQCMLMMQWTCWWFNGQFDVMDDKWVMQWTSWWPIALNVNVTVSKHVSQYVSVLKCRSCWCSQPCLFHTCRHIGVEKANMIWQDISITLII